MLQFFTLIRFITLKMLLMLRVHFLIPIPGQRARKDAKSAQIRIFPKFERKPALILTLKLTC